MESMENPVEDKYNVVEDFPEEDDIAGTSKSSLQGGYWAGKIGCYVCWAGLILREKLSYLKW